MDFQPLDKRSHLREPVGAGLLLLQLRLPEAILPARNSCRRGGYSPSSLGQNSNASSLLQHTIGLA